VSALPPLGGSDPVKWRTNSHTLTDGALCRYAPWPPSDVSAALQAVDRRILAAPELTASLLTAVSAMASGAPSSMLPSAMLRLWTRATALEMAAGVHNGARDAALQAAVDLLATAAPSMCSQGGGATQYELAVGMKESHAWLRLKVGCVRHGCTFHNSTSITTGFRGLLVGDESDHFADSALKCAALARVAVVALVVCTARITTKMLGTARLTTHASGGCSLPFVVLSHRCWCR
jgi:hypothetical protein